MPFQIADPAGLGGGRLDPRLKLLSRLTPKPSSQELSPEEERAREQKALNGLWHFLVRRDRVRQIEEQLIPAEGRDIPARIYKPDAPSPMPLLVFLHGGGWVLGGLRQADAVCRRLAKRGKCIVISVDYRLAPEHKFPAALEDTLAVLDWAFERAIKFGGDSARLGVAGGSAGGTLAAAACLAARQRGTPPIRFQILFNPVTNLAQMDTDSHRQFGSGGYGMTTAMLEKRRGQYLSAREEQLDPRVSPLLAEDLRNLPPALILTAEFDPLRDEAERYAVRLEEAGVEARGVRYQGAIHGFFNFVGFLPQADAALDEAASFLRQVNQ
jgi:acetyl esterase